MSPTRGENPKMRAINREQRAGNSQLHVLSIEPANDKLQGASDEREEPTSEKQEPSSKWAVNSKGVTASSKLSIAKREQRKEKKTLYSDPLNEYLQRKLAIATGYERQPILCRHRAERNKFRVAGSI